MLSHGHLFHVSVIRALRTIWLVTPTQILEWGAIIMKTILYRKCFPKNQKSNKKVTPLPPLMPRLFMGNTCNFSHHKQQRIYQFNIAWSTRNTPVNPRLLKMFYYMKKIEGRGRLTEGMQYYFINIVLSVKLISLFSSEVTLIYLYLPWKNKRKCNALFWIM